jgi:hypothetical protein
VIVNGASFRQYFYDALGRLVCRFSSAVCDKTIGFEKTNKQEKLTFDDGSPTKGLHSLNMRDYLTLEFPSLNLLPEPPR